MHTFSKGLFLGLTTGVCITSFYQNKKYRELQFKYYTMKTQFIEHSLFKTKPYDV